jgi:hypothetical protein
VGLSFSNDFLQWTPVETLLVTDARDDELAQERVARFRDRCEFVGGPEWHLAQFYGMAGFPYEGIYLGLLWVFDSSGSKKLPSPSAIGGGGEDGIIVVELTYSRDLRHWKRVCDRQVFLPLGKPRTWDAGRIYLTVNRPLIVEDEIWIYYGASQPSKGHTLISEQWWNRPIEEVRKRYPNLDFNLPIHAIGLAKLRLDGFVSLDAESEEGVFLTKPLVFQGKRLTINAKSEGGITVELLDENRQPLPACGQQSDVFRGDSVRQTVTWHGDSDLSKLAGKPVRLRFRLSNSKLYSFVFTS